MVVRFWGRLVGLAALSLLLATGFSAGCSGQDDGLYRFHGTATYRGKPIPRGTIMFEPDTSKGNQGPAGSAAIENGRFDSELNGSGFVGGPHLVTIQGFSGENVDSDFAPYGTPIGRGKSYIEPIDLPHEDVELEFDMAKLVDK